MQQVFDRPPVRIDAQPSLGPALLGVEYRGIKPGDGAAASNTTSTMPPWAAALHLKLDTILRQQQRLQAHLDAQTWSARWSRFLARLRRLFTR